MSNSSSDKSTQKNKCFLARNSTRLRHRSKTPRRRRFQKQQTLGLRPEEWKCQHDEISNTLRRGMMILVSYSLFCMLTLGAPDELLIVSGAKIKVPFTGTEVDFVSFLILGPLILLGICIYQHVFLSQWHALGTCEKATRLPYLFNMEHRGANALAGFIFYWLPPTVLIVFVLKALPRPVEAHYLLIMTAMTCTGSVLLQINRCPVEKRLKKIFLWPLLFATCFLYPPIVETIANAPFYTSRNLELFRVDLSEKYLTGAYLYRANLSQASLTSSDLSAADLSAAHLSAAHLRKADLSKADLSKADLRWTDLRWTDLSKANLRAANLRAANLRAANLRAANLSKADLSEADLSEADLSEADLRGATVKQIQLNKACGEPTTLPTGLTIKPCSKSEDGNNPK